MSIQRFEQGDIEVFTIQTAPSTTFISSSVTGTTGSAYVYARRSNAIKQFNINYEASGAPPEAFYSINNIGEILKQAKLSTTPTELNQRVSQYLGAVGQQPQNVRNVQKQEVIRFTPGDGLDKNMTRKFVTTNLLMPYYSSCGTCYDFAYTNYSTLNFFIDKNLPNNSALIYPTTGSSPSVGQIITSSYVASGAFSFDFWINPRYTNNDPTDPVYKAGTIYHLSSAYALSLISGSSRDTNGYVDGYRLLLQLSNSADTPPSFLDPSSLPSLAFLSNDNSLARNTWQHVTVRWGTESYNFGSGSFLVDGVELGTFYIPSASVAPKRTTTADMPCTLVVGNYLELPASNTGRLFFSKASLERFGIPVSGFALDSSTTQDEPSSYTMQHPLKAEVHELKIYSKFLPDAEIASRSLTGASLEPSLLFYVPPFFTKESPTRSVDLYGLGGVMTHPFQAIYGTTDQPFNTYLSFDTGGHYINLENHTRDFATGNYPRLIKLTGSANRKSGDTKTANQILYATGSIQKASLTVLPNDNGQFMPNYYELLSTLNTSSFVTDKGNEAYNLVSLRNLYSQDALYDLVSPTTNSLNLNSDTGTSIIEQLQGLNVTSSYGVLDPSRVPAIFQRTYEAGSLQVVIFDISNLFYGNKIAPNTFTITDTAVANSYGRVGITLKDDGFGSLYRADCTGSQAQYNSVGNIFYDNGIVLIKNPSLYWFGENGFTCTFQGERNIHVMKADLYANPLELVSSSNPSWNRDLQSSDNASDFDKRYVYITDLYLHDDNLNVIAKTKLAQPVLKKSGDKLKFTVKLDF